MKLTILMFVALFAATTFAQNTTFTYQGRLTDSTLPASGTYQMKFSVWDAVTLGTQQGTTVTNNAVTVANGVFAVQLDFTATPFATGANRWIEVAVRKLADPPGFTTLTPRQPVTASPYATRSLSASSADAAIVAGNVTGVVAIANGGTGSPNKNFVDLSTNQAAIAGNKTFTGTLAGNGSGLTNLNGANLTAASVTTDKLAPVFGYFTNSFIPFTIPPGGSIPFANAGPVSGIVSIGGTDFILPDTGVYEVAWQVNVQEPGALALALNGIQQPATVVGRDTGATQIVGHVLINVNAGDVLSVRAASNNFTALTIDHAVGGNTITCSLVIKRIK